MATKNFTLLKEASCQLFGEHPEDVISPIDSAAEALSWLEEILTLSFFDKLLTDFELSLGRFFNDKVKILKDSLKWALVIKENSVETGWIRKEYLNLKIATNK
jgi:hypothetical protein